MGRHDPARAEAGARYFRLGDPDRLRGLFEAAGFRDVEVFSETRCYASSSFDAYFAPFDGGTAVIGEEYAALPEEARRAVREEIRCQIEGEALSGGPVEVPVEIPFGSGRR